jgi:hypothetical protein
MYALAKSDGTQFQAHKFKIAISLRFQRENLESESKLDRDLPKRDFLILQIRFSSLGGNVGRLARSMSAWRSGLS